MKTYLLMFEGDPKRHLKELNNAAPEEEPISILSIAHSLHLVAAHESVAPEMIAAALAGRSSDDDIYLFPASLPIYPAVRKSLLAEAIRILAMGEDGPVPM